jgi:hypothetical protein
MALSILTRFATKTAIIAGVTAGLGRILAELCSFGSNKTERIETLTFREAVGFFAERPEDIRIARGALMREKRVKETLVTWAFLDAANQPVKNDSGVPLGKRMLVKEFDPELTDYFGDADLIVFE